jgi:predicted transcriptional regulator
MKVLLSIKPEFADKIFDGSKQYEFRRLLFKNRNIKTIVVYASSPVQKVIGEFQIDTILKQDIYTLWQNTCTASGITEDYFFRYFRDKTDGFAIKIKKPRRYKTPKCIRKHFNASPPQSFLYIS